MNKNLKEFLGLILRCGLREVVIKNQPKQTTPQNNVKLTNKPRRDSDVSR